MGDPFFFERRDLRGGAQLFHQHRDQPWCAIGLAIVAGHFQDPVGKEGTAHLLEHQVSNGRIGDLPMMPLKDLQHWLHRRRLSASLGSTSRYWTRYGGRAENANVGMLVRFLTDLVFRPGLDGDLEREREIVRAERGHHVSDRSDRIATDVAYAEFGDHRRNTGTSLPDDDVLNGLTLDDLKAYHRRHYAPVNARFVVIGGMPIDEVADLLDGLLPESGPDAVDVGCVAQLALRRPDPNELRFPREDGRPVETASVRRVWRLPRRYDEVDTAAAHALSSLLHQRIREDLCLAYGIGASNVSSYDHHAFKISTTVDAAKVDGVLAEIGRIMRDEDAICRAFARQDHLLRPGLVIYDGTCAEVVAQALSSITECGQVLTRAEVVRRSEAVTEGQVLDFLRHALTPESSMTVVVEKQ